VAVNGMGTKYNLAAFQNFAAPGVASSPTGVNFMQLQLGVSYGRKLAEGHFIGVTPILGIQRFMARGLEPFQPLSVSPGDVTNNGHDYSYGLGARLGWLGQITENFALGASYQTKIHQSEFDDYKGLFAGGDMDIPANYTVGLAFTPSPGLTLALDYQRIRYEDVKSISNPNNYPLAPNSLGSKNGIGFGWKDSKIVKLGVEWKYRSDLILRGGFSMANQVIPKDQALFNMLAPATVRKHLTLGFTKKLDKHNEINVSFMHAFKEKVSGSNPNVGSQTGSLEMEQNEIEISWGKVF
ncbi:MAG: transporter, partial [Gammaproteobacteria bacterium]|nr:transporter [Gammaproteobacteria bacterium]